MRATTWLVFGSILCAASGARAEDDLFPFDEVEPVVTAAPSNVAQIGLNDVQQVLDIAVSPTGPNVAVLVSAPNGQQTLLRWSIGKPEAEHTVLATTAPTIKLNSLSWHPKGTQLYAAGGKTIYAIAANGTPKQLWHSNAPVERLVSGPRPFKPGFRLFFNERQSNGTRWIASIDEKGAGYYVVTAATPPAAKPSEDGDPPMTEKIADAVPVNFHPAGDLLLLADKQGCFKRKFYQSDNWAASEPLKEACGGTIAYTPNGAALMRWKPGQAGIELVNLVDKTRQKLLPAREFVSEPRFTADGRGIVGVAKQASGLALVYEPLSLPLADVVNAWQFIETPTDQSKLAEFGGLFRPIAIDQLYKLYDTESYTCGSYDYRTPVRPYLVTTDIFWEVYGAAYQGIFLEVERARAMPAFRTMLAKASAELAQKAPNAELTKKFQAVVAILAEKAGSNELASKITADPTFAARGAYTKDKASATYFTAVRYLATLQLKPDEAVLIAGLSDEAKKAADDWIGSYETFIAASRAELAWNNGRKVAAYTSRRPDTKALFPLSWGWDNETFDRSVDHIDLPMEGKDGKRLLPTAFDVAMVFGNPLAESLLGQIGQFDKFPELRGRLRQVQADFGKSVGQDGETLYGKWLRALAVQWTKAPSTPISGAMWDAKRLQTGLASWATLRHTTILVNDLAAAECGEAGFEAIVMRPPRGYVEPDPATFQAIAALYDSTIAAVRRLWPAGTPLSEGIIRRLEESRDQTRQFGAIAEKEVNGVALSPEDYAAIHYVGRAAEHNFLVFYSLQSEENALVNPDPVTKIAEVAGSRETGYLEAAVGKPLEWDLIAPSFGRREIAKGAVYSFHQFASKVPVTDEAWRKQIEQQPLADWVKPYASDKVLSCPPARP